MSFSLARFGKLAAAAAPRCPWVPRRCHTLLRLQVRTLRAAARTATSQVQLINYKEYPIHESGSASYEALVAKARRGLDETGCVRLPGFITEEGVGLLKDECMDIVGRGGVLGNQVGRAVNCYYTEADASLPASHPVNTFFERSFGAVRDDMIGEADALRQVYDDVDVVSFVADVLGVPVLYQSRDSYQALTVNVLGAADNLHWHFDCNACAVTLGIQLPSSGGEFEFVPHIGRSNHEAIASVIGGGESAATTSTSTTSTTTSHTGGGGVVDGPGTAAPSGHAGSQTFDTEEGALVFFCGGESLHRVRAVQGDRLRLVAALQFHTSDTAFDPPEMTQRIYGVHPTAHVGPKPSVVCSRS